MKNEIKAKSVSPILLFYIKNFKINQTVSSRAKRFLGIIGFDVYVKKERQERKT